MSTSVEPRDRQRTGARPPPPYRPVHTDIGRRFGAAIANTAAVGEIAVRERAEALQAAVRRKPLEALVMALGAGWLVGRIFLIDRRLKVR